MTFTNAGPGECNLPDTFQDAVRRLVETSRGWIELDFRANPYGRFFRRLGPPGGYAVLITPFAKDGWSQRDEIGWLSGAPNNGKSLSVFLSEIAAIPVEEAERIATESVEEWERRR